MTTLLKQIKKLIFLNLVVFFSSITTYSQVINDDFEDGDITGWIEGTASHWVNSTTNPITAARSLKHNFSGTSGDSYIYQDISSLDLTTENITWQFNLKTGSWDPSSSNKFWVYLTANNNDLNGSSVDGYAVGVNLTGSSDFLTLWKVTNGEADGAVITTAIDWNANNTKGIRVTRTNDGLWELLVDNDGGFEALMSMGTATNTDYTFDTNFGLSFTFSATRAGLLWMDDVFVQGVDATLSVNDLTISLDEVLVFMTDKRSLTVNGLQNTHFSVRLYSIIGEQVLNKSFISNGVNNISLPQTLASGIYIVKLTTYNSEILSKKIVIE
ncbi:T9SS type A sorting domain-containing protein [Flavivirga jejuensis]|uniref:T9SS type A sorting domain-containing protein n=1 Tax=Flavivirga jejuensis TaxID=870487 RepID=A0ABT8WSK7_9FLAO|nr:T9SS type A sorting domain-containing protein [Flavivirga jejuensis]MDO5976094.1 T9SS type A sorting domain-containing protein [Flavivirga jejuensis]